MSNKDEPELQTIRHDQYVSFISHNKTLIDDVTRFIDGVIKESNNALLTQAKTGWLKDYLFANNLQGSAISKNTYYISTEEQLKAHASKEKESHEQSIAWKKEQALIKQMVLSRPFSYEFQFIIDYIKQAFEGHSGEDIQCAMSEILKHLTTDIVTNKYCMASKDIAIDERYAISAFLRANGYSLESMNITLFTPSDHKDISTIDAHKHWEQMRAEVKALIKDKLPRLYPISLKALLDDESAEIPEPPVFNGLKLESAGSFDFAHRVHPRSLRYDQQEQANPWLNILSGAIVAHYHQFIECKQHELIRTKLITLSDMLIDDPRFDIYQAMLSCTKQVSGIAN